MRKVVEEERALVGMQKEGIHEEWRFNGLLSETALTSSARQ